MFKKAPLPCDLLISIDCVVGCDESQQSRQLYERVELKHASVTAFFGKLAAARVLATYGPSALLLISYASLGYPAPDHWTLPIQLQ